jgi:hypothetical protein
MRAPRRSAVASAVKTGRLTQRTGEFAREMAVVAEASLQRHCSDGPVRLNQKLAGFSDAELTEVVGGADLKSLFEVSLEAPRGHARDPGEFCHVDAFGVVLADVVKRRCELGERGREFSGLPQVSGNAGESDDFSMRGSKRYFGGHIPVGAAWVAHHHFNALPDLVSGENSAIVARVLVREVRWNKVVVTHSENRRGVAAAVGEAHAAARVHVDAEGVFDKKTCVWKSVQQEEPVLAGKLFKKFRDLPFRGVHVQGCSQTLKHSKERFGPMPNPQGWRVCTQMCRPRTIFP